ncbi:hypothetical protein [Pseudomonas viridiflava]|uniref:hypothetical protein n=1 Tax=Pseudomonas viridiflava TaxID=33069 RepID=UPI000F04BEC0|nr:hypothetical protein [Pseudomonas viridiflava]
MLVKILDANPEFVEALKSQTGTTTASKAFAYAADRYQHLRCEIWDQAVLIESLTSDLAKANRVIEGARTAAALLLEKTGQLDLLDN